MIVRPWPFWSLLGVTVLVAYYGDWRIVDGGPGFNKVAGAVLQAIGALLVLISLDGNIGLFAGKGIVSAAAHWMSDYPKKIRGHALAGGASLQSNSSLAATLSIRPTALDERVAELERVVAELKAISSARHDELTQAIATARAEARDANSKTSTGLKALEKKLEVSAIGGLKIQSFGVGIALIGSLLSMFS